MTNLRVALFYTLGVVPAVAAAVTLELGMIPGSFERAGPLSVFTTWFLRPFLGALLVYLPLAWLVHKRLAPATRHIARTLPLYITLVVAAAVVMSFIPSRDDFTLAVYVAHFPAVSAFGGIVSDVILGKAISRKERARR